jgi:inner membrane transporter RhtA
VSAVTARAAPAGPAIALVLAAVASVQVGAAFAATLFDELGAEGAVFLRLAFAALVLGAVWRPRLREHAGNDLRTAALFGVVVGLMNWAFYASIDRIPLGVAVTLEFVGPLGVAVAASRRRRDLVWVALAALGILLLGNPFGAAAEDLDLLGAGLALAAGGCWAAYILLSARVGAAFPGGSGLALAMVVGTLVVAPAGIATAGSALLEPGLLLAAAGVALLSSVIPYSFELEALRRLPAGVFGVLMSLEPAVAALAGLVVLGQDLGATELAANACVVAASAGATVR